jgi:cellulose biosynthesis protein BcsQ
MSTVIAVSNYKGGVGKSFVSTCISNACGNKGQKVLLIDWDSQANSTDIILGKQPPSYTLYDVLANNLPIETTIQATSYDNLDILANEPACAALEVTLYQNIPKSYYRLRELLEPLRNTYDLIVIDTSPSLGIWTIMALIACDCVIVPLNASSKHSLQGLNAAITAIRDVSKSFNPNLKFLRGIINMVDRRTSISKAMVEQITRTWAGQLFQTTIPLCTDVQQAEFAGETLLRYAPHSTAAKRFRALADELITIISTASDEKEDILPGLEEVGDGKA